MRANHDRCSRRQAVGGVLVGGASVAWGCGGTPTSAATATGGTSTAGAEGTSGPLARVREHAVVPLPFDPAQLDGLSEQLLRSHHENNYAGAVRKLNACRAELAGLPDDAPAFVWGGLQRSELAFANSALLHELYFENLGGEGGEPQPLEAPLTQSFGSLQAWQGAFVRCAASLAGGSGWVILAYDAYRRELVHRVCADHGHAGAYDVPLLVLDMYEHSYHMDYGAAAAQYVDAFLRNVSWAVVAGRYEHASSRHGANR